MATPKGQGEIERNMLDGKQKYRLMQWLDTQRDRIERQKLTAPELAKEATTALGFTISPGNVYGAVGTIDLVLPQAAKRQATLERGKLQAEALATLPETLADILARLGHLERELGVKLQGEKAAG